MNRRNNKVVFKHDHDEKIDVPQEPPMMPELAPAPASAPAPAHAPSPDVAPKTKRVVKPKGERKTNTWVSHVKQVASEKGLTYKQAMAIARESYKR